MIIIMLTSMSMGMSMSMSIYTPMGPDTLTRVAPMMRLARTC
jgi:hypothetical protein